MCDEETTAIVQGEVSKTSAMTMLVVRPGAYKESTAWMATWQVNPAQAEKLLALRPENIEAEPSPPQNKKT